jgi:hypothetical protein
MQSSTVPMALTKKELQASMHYRRHFFITQLRHGLRAEIAFLHVLCLAMMDTASFVMSQRC